jgi:chromosomal replication initiation ATPase DnaA
MTTETCLVCNYRLLKVSIPVASKSNKITIDQIIKAACETLKIKLDLLTSERKTGDLVAARHIIYNLSREFTLLSLKAIGSRFGQDHSGVIYGSKKCDEQKDLYKNYRAKYNAVRYHLLQNQSGRKILAW